MKIVFNQPGLLQLQFEVVWLQFEVVWLQFEVVISGDLQKTHKYATLTSPLKEFTNCGEALGGLRNLPITSVLHDVM